MKEDFFKTKDGSMLKVFYLKKDEPNKGIVDEMVADFNNLADENSADESKHECLCAPSIHGCCPVGEKGESGEIGLREEELVIKTVLDGLSETQINIASETARIFLAREIARDLRDADMFSNGYFLE